MLNFIFSPDWYLPSLIFSIFHILINVYNEDKNNSKFGERFWNSIALYATILVLIPILTPILIISEFVSNIDFEELKNDFLEIFDTNKNSKCSSSAKNKRQNETKETNIEKKLSKMMVLLENGKWLSVGGYNYNNLNFGYKEFSDISFYYSIVDNWDSIIKRAHSFTKNEDYKNIHNKIYDVAIGIIDFYISVISDQFLDKIEAIELIDNFNVDAKVILNKLIDLEYDFVKDRKRVIEENERVEREIKEAKEKELSKISYEKFNDAKDDMLNTLNIVAGIKRQ